MIFLQTKTNSKGEIYTMFKKISFMTVLSATLILGGIFSSTAFAAQADTPSVQTYSKVYFSVNNNFSNWNKYINQYLKNLQNNNVSQEKVEQPEQNELQQPEQNQTEQPTEQPEQQPTQKPVEQPQEEQVQEPTKQPEEQQNQDQSYQLNDFEQQVFDLTNNERTKNGLSALKVDLELSRVAREKSQDMANRNYFDHNSPTYGSPFDMMKAYGIDYRSAGENIAKGQRTPAEVVNAWMNSPGHRANILKADFTHIGLGYVSQGDHWTQQFIGK